ncbi:MAG TPA: VOC family protein [Thermoplasmata archaeon]|nr:VOC family protein [Thermoplasmata archaeon]
MLGGSDLIAFVAATDMARTKTFYGDIMGLALKADDGFALVFDCNGTMLRVSKVQKATVAPYTVLGWSVRDIRGKIQELGKKGVVFERFQGFPQDDLGAWTAPDGTKVAWFKDPEGNLLSLTEFH